MSDGSVRHDSDENDKRDATWRKGEEREKEKGRERDGKKEVIG